MFQCASLATAKRPARAAAFALLVASLAGLGLGGSDGDGGGARRVAGDGRGLATFGDRALTSFGRRFDTSFATRPLTSFGDAPLVPMGGLITGGDAPGDGTRIEHHHHFSHRNDSGGFDAQQWAGSEASQQLDRYDDDDAADGSWFLMPAVALPAVVLDHRPAAATLEATLAAAIRRARAAGDLDLARSLDPERR